MQMLWLSVSFLPIGPSVVCVVCLIMKMKFPHRNCQNAFHRIPCRSGLFIKSKYLVSVFKKRKYVAGILAQIILMQISSLHMNFVLENVYFGDIT